jgi:predicted nucleotidyltransferase
VLDKKNILFKIKSLIKEIEPDAKIILFGSTARGDSKENSDIDLLILVNKNHISRKEEKRIKYPLYDLEFDTGQIISPFIISALEWENKHSFTPLYKNIKEEGIEL